ncbi:hypothetical protein [Streptomyces antibioticus]|uniref:Uncharacterized protein n=1 Tax=Streptomyces antibioticus TaxID=1890 RepID=A0AAE6Y9J7_STRAT|nr:hypothetical protein [Streptomyces antibioticus]QIT44789.1 hypothetical protein HCX60_15505 [Streptomyces antibioticus]
MTNSSAFTAGAQQGNWWTNHIATAPEREAKQRAMRTEQERMIEQYQREQHRQAVMSSAGPAILDLIQGYLDRNTPAVARNVEADFVERLPGSTASDFRTALEYLKQAGQIHELVSSTQGFMGEKTTHLYPLEG